MATDRPLIQLENVGRIYCTTEGTETVALQEASFSINKGEFVAIMGASGSGKSTLLHILGMLDRPTTGNYFYDGRNTSEFDEDQLAFLRNDKIGFVFQSFNLLRRTSVFDNVKLPLYYSNTPQNKWDDLVNQAIDSVDLEHRKDHETSMLSGGEQQRVAIARAIVNQPQLIFADEPTGNLDSKSGGIIMEIIDGLNEKGHTVVLITHEKYTSEYARRLIVLKDGRIIQDKKRTKLSRGRDGFTK